MLWHNFILQWFKGWKIIGRGKFKKSNDLIYSEAKKYNCNIFIPEDCNVSTDAQS